MDFDKVDMLKAKLLDSQENVRDYQEYAGKCGDREVAEVFMQFAEESGMQARKLQELLSKCGE